MPVTHSLLLLRCSAIHCVDTEEWDYNADFFPLSKAFLIALDYKEVYTMQTEYHISNTKNIWNFHEYTKVTLTTGDEICPGALPGLWTPGA